MASSKLVAHISSVHKTFDTRIFEKECKSLVHHGYDVKLIVQHTANQIIDGISIISLPIANKKTERLTKVLPAILKKVFKLDIKTIIHLHDPELLPLGVLLKLFGYKVIYDVHEDLPKDILSKEWLPIIFRSVLSKVVKVTEFLCTACFDGIITVTEPINKRFRHPNKVIVKNYPRLDNYKDFASVSREEYVVYIGDITLIRGVIEMVEAINISASNNIKLKLGGRFAPPELRDQILNETNSSKIEFCGWLSQEEIAKILSKAMCGLVVLHPVSGYLNAYPVKMFEYMASGTPVIASDFPLWRTIIKDAECGLLVNPMKPLEIAEAIQWLLDHPEEAKKMGESGRKAVMEKYNWAKEEKKLLDLYQHLID